MLQAEYLASLPDGIPVRAVSSLQRPSPRSSPRFTAAVQRSPGAAAGEPATAGTYGEQGYLARSAEQRGPRCIPGGEKWGTHAVAAAKGGLLLRTPPPTVVLEVGRDAGVERHFHICVWLYPGHFLRLAAPGDFHL